MTLVNCYTDVAALRAQLNDTSAQRLPVAAIERAITAASRAIDRWCGRRFWKDAEPTTKTYLAQDPHELWVHDIADLAGLVVKTGRSGGTWTTTWSSADFDVEPVASQDDTARAWSMLAVPEDGAQRFPTGSRTATVQVTARWGWSAVPVDVEQAAIIRAASLFNRKDSIHGVAGFGDFGPVRITRRDADVVDLLNGFHRIRTPDL